MKISVIVPVYNEEKTLPGILQRVFAVLDTMNSAEVILVEDRSTDGTWELIKQIVEEHAPGTIPIRAFRQPRNRGKGAALRRGFAEAEGDILLVQDADLEYDPADYPRLLEPLIRGRADVVYGSRLQYGIPPGITKSAFLANRFLTWLSNSRTGLSLTDMETCYKALRRDLIHGMELREDRFGFEPEITARLAARNARFEEIPITYSPRSVAEGKKIGWKDAVSAIRCILRY